MLKYQRIIEELTLEEKAGLCSGLDFWNTKPIERCNIPSIMMSDGPNGLRVQRGRTDEDGIEATEPSTCFPAEATICNSWNLDLVFQEGEAIAEEALAEKVSIVLAPGVNIKRSPLCGRNFEYFSEDPYLAGKMGISYIKGIQSKGIGACVKHFAGNNQEERRMTINAIIDERTLREIYLSAFEMVVKEAKPWAVMSAYNRLNGYYCTENKKLLEILKREWKHEGIVITDWGAENDRVKGLIAGNELEMPATDGTSDQEIVNAVKNKEIEESLLDERIDRIIDIIMKAVKAKTENYSYDSKGHNELARKLAEDSIVLLKNEEKILPVRKEDSIAIIGDMAKNPRYQGAGSSITKPERLDNIIVCLEKEKIPFEYAQGYSRIESRQDKILLQEACKIAKEKDKVLLFVGLTENYESEGMDRRNLQIPQNQQKLIQEICKINSNVIIILAGGAPVEMPWEKDVKAIVHGYLGGQAGAKAMIRVIIGEVNPSGKLSETYPIKLEDTPSYENFPGNETMVKYKEGIYVGYRYYDTAKKEVLFPFGYGLSYTEFEYSDLKIQKKEINWKETDEIQVSFKVKNIGDRAGAEISQLYISQVSPTIYKADKELKGFSKVFLQPKEETEIILSLDKRAFSYYNVEKEGWAIESGSYKVLIGKSSKDIQLGEVIEVISEDTNISTCYSEHYKKANIKEISDEDFEQLFIGKLPIVTQQDKTILMDHTMEQAKHTFVGGIIYHNKKGKIKRLLRKQKVSEATKLIMDLQRPFRSYARRQNEEYNKEMVEGFIEVLNGHWMKGFRRIYKGKNENRSKRKRKIEKKRGK